MRTLLLILTITALSGISSYAQTISGTLINKSSNLPVAYANIGIVGKTLEQFQTPMETLDWILIPTTTMTLFLFL